MERETLQQQVPVYHVCQQCNGAGCAACSDLCILDGDIQLDPEWSDELPPVMPINGVIGITSSLEFSSAERCASVANLYARMPARPVHAEWLRDLEV